MAIDKRVHQTILGLADFLEGKKDAPAASEAVCLDFLEEVLPLMLDPMVPDRHMKLRLACIEFSGLWRETLYEGH
jgi:hypothetical protein